MPVDLSIAPYSWDFEPTWKETLQANCRMIYGVSMKASRRISLAHQTKCDPVTLWKNQETMRPLTTQHHSHHTIFSEQDVAAAIHVSASDSLKRSATPYERSL
ncbi:hypothetical protein NPIL_358891 [Nephila pilipes]|uniref:Uncharacterized protein n=1 Tax=Nephila pilipes TaxID=299642 RepID=A0A8X6Q3G0_NEPPI|nr:hypothetical protein NPIL_358891 [Nephila pilipes]